MRRSLFRRLLCTVAVIITGMVGLAGPSAAADPDSVLDFAAGQACDFALRVEVNGSSRVQRTFYDRDGNPVRTLSAGTGSTLTFINLDRQRNTYTTKSNGAVARTVPNGDGTSTVTTGGHNVIFLFPTDIPAGPSTTLYVGQVVYLTDDASKFTLLKTSGRSVDICKVVS